MLSPVFGFITQLTEEVIVSKLPLLFPKRTADGCCHQFIQWTKVCRKNHSRSEQHASGAEIYSNWWYWTWFRAALCRWSHTWDIEFALQNCCTKGGSKRELGKIPISAYISKDTWGWIQQCVSSSIHIVINYVLQSSNARMRTNAASVSCTSGHEINIE